MLTAQKNLRMETKPTKHRPTNHRQKIQFFPEKKSIPGTEKGTGLEPQTIGSEGNRITSRPGDNGPGICQGSIIKQHQFLTNLFKKS